MESLLQSQCLAGRSCGNVKLTHENISYCDHKADHVHNLWLVNIFVPNAIGMDRLWLHSVMQAGRPITVGTMASDMPDERLESPPAAEDAAPASAAGADRLALAGDRNLENAAATRLELARRLQPGVRLELDLADVAEADLSLLQLVLAARRTAAATGGALALRPAPAPAVRALAEAAGLLADPAERIFWEGDRP
jgi:hypothetical protein